MTELEKTIRMPALEPKFPYMPKSEWKSRVEKAREWMEKEGIDAIMTTHEKNWIYYFGFRKPYPYNFLTVGIVPRDGPTTMVDEGLGSVNLEVTGYAENRVQYSGHPNPPTPQAAEPVELFAEVIKDLKLDKGTIGVEMGFSGGKLSSMFWDGMTLLQWERIKKALPDVKFVNATDLIWEQRYVKSKWEQDVMRKLYRVTGKAYRKVFDMAEPGINEYDIFKEMMKIFVDGGIVDSTAWHCWQMQSQKFEDGKYIIACMGFFDRELKKGDILILDGGPSYLGYEADCQRFVAIGDPGPKIRKLAWLDEIGTMKAEEILGPGTRMGDLWTKPVEEMAKYDPEQAKLFTEKEFITWFGHGNGLNLHEPPYIVKEEDYKLKPGMTICIEIPTMDCENGLHLANMPENVYLITETGFENITEELGPYGLWIKK